MKIYVARVTEHRQLSQSHAHRTARGAVDLAIAHLSPDDQRGLRLVVRSFVEGRALPVHGVAAFYEPSSTRRLALLLDEMELVE